MGGTYTPNLHLYKPLKGEVGWDAAVNANFDTLDSTIEALEVQVGGLVTSVFGRTGAVVSQTGDYSFSQISGKAGLAQGGTNADLSGTGGASQVLKQVSAGAPITVGQLAVSDISGISAIAGSGAWSALQNASANLTLSNAGFTTEFDQTSAASWKWKNTTTATSGTTNASPVLTVAQNYWTGAASAEDNWTLQATLAAGTNGASTLTITHSGSTGNAAVALPATSASPWFVSGATLQLGNTGPMGLSVVNSTLFFATTTATAEMRLYPNNSATLQMQLGYNANSCPASTLTLCAANSPLALRANVVNTAQQGSIQLGNASNYSPTTGTQIAVAIGSGGAPSNASSSFQFSPASGAANFVALSISPVISQTGTASGSYTGLLVNVVETALLGTANKLLDLQSGVTGGVSVFNVDRAGNLTQLNATVATSGTTNASPMQTLSANYWTGAASAADTWTVQSTLAAGTNGASTLTIAHAGSTGNAILSTPAMIAIASASPASIASNTLSNQTGFLYWTGTSGIFLADSAGANFRIGFYVQSGRYNLSLNNAGLVAWTSSATAGNTAADTAFSRLAAGSLALGNGTASDKTGTLSVGTLIEGTTLTPTSAATAGVTGQIAWDATNIYVCTAGGAAGAATWKKAALAAA